MLIVPVVLWLLDLWHLVLATAAALLLWRPAADLIRFLFAPRAARRHYLGHDPGPASLALALPLHRPRPARTRAKNRPAAESRVLVLVLLFLGSKVLALLLGIEVGERAGKIHYPHARRWRLTDYGWQCQVKTAPRTGRKEVEKQAVHIADYWRSVRVGVNQAAPGQLIVRALRTDPLAEPFGPDRCPPGTFEPHVPDLLYVGRDDFGADRYLPLRGLTGICVSGLPGYGKTSLINSWLCQLATTERGAVRAPGRQERRRPGTLARPRLAPRRRPARRRPRRARGRPRRDAPPPPLDHRPLRSAEHLERQRPHQ